VLPAPKAKRSPHCEPEESRLWPNPSSEPSAFAPIAARKRAIRPLPPGFSGRGGNLLRRRFSDQITDPADHAGSAMGVLDDPVQRKRKYGRAARPGAATP
jgi:hypothetical protein